MTFKTFVKKIKHLAQKQYLKNFAINEYMFFVGDKSIFRKKDKKIVMYFPDYEFMHLGDHFFFEPLASVLDKNFEFKIMPIKMKIRLLVSSFLIWAKQLFIMRMTPYGDLSIA